MVSKISNFESSDLPDYMKAALRIARMIAQYPKGVTDEMWEQARAFYSEQELADIVWFAAFSTGSKMNVTLGLDPGEGHVLYPTDSIYKAQKLDATIDELRAQGVSVSADA